MKNSKPLVSISCLTYNHSKFIKQCLDGFLMQQTNFNFEILIHDDASTDGTTEIIKKYESKYPNIIKPIYQKENQWSKGKSISVTYNFPRAQGKYVALCEGDDYWTDPYKLQKQVDFLEENEEYSFSFHDAYILNNKTNQKFPRIGNKKIDNIVGLNSLIKKNNIPTASLVFRNNLNWNNLPKWFFNTAKGDYGLVILLAEQGLGFYIDKIMSVYRVHGAGVWSGKDQRYRFNEDLKFYGFLLDYFNDKKTQETIKKKIRYVKANQGLFLIKNGRVLKGSLVAIIFNNWFGCRDLRVNFKQYKYAFTSFIKKIYQ